MLAVPGATGQLVRTGPGRDTARIKAASVDGIQVAILDIGFSSVGAAVADADSMILCTMLTTPGAGTWEGVDLEPGQTFVYPAGSTHHAIDPAGIRFAMTVISSERFAESALALGFDPDSATTKRVVHGGPLGRTVASYIRATRHQNSFGSTHIDADRVLESATRTLAAHNPGHDLTSGNGWHDADLVNDTIEFLEHNQLWRVPILTLCRHVAASERRLELAFHRLYGIGPHKFMRFRALQAAHRALGDSDRATTTVAEIASSHGFAHAGRFAQLHKDVYGQSPSSALRS